MQRFLGFGLICLMAATVAGQSIHGRGGITLPAAPHAEAIPVKDDYFGTTIVDNYRWLESANSPETKEFIDQENAYTDSYLKQARFGLRLPTIWTHWNMSRAPGRPSRAATIFSLRRCLAGEDQYSIYVRHGWAEKDKRLIDPAQFSRDPNTSVDLVDVSRDGTLVAYQVREGGADESTVRIFNVKTGKTLEDELPSGIYLAVNFTPDGKGLIYSRMNAKGTLVYEHVFGTRNSQDKLIFGNEFRGEALGHHDLIVRPDATTTGTWWSKSIVAYRPSAWTSFIAT